MGEGCASDAELMKYVSSTNVACGFHAGDRETMKRTVDLALENGVAVGAHPGYKDRANFGRTDQHLPVKQVYEVVTEQIAELSRIAESCGTQIAHVKPHGALYNQAAKDAELAAAIAQAVSDFDDTLILFGLSASASISEAQKYKLQTANEVFADRTYQRDGSLTPRTLPNALIDDPERSAMQVLDMVKYGRVRSTEGIVIKVVADTVCIHGDGPNAVEIAEILTRRLADESIDISAPCNAK